VLGMLVGHAAGAENEQTHNVLLDLTAGYRRSRRKSTSVATAASAVACFAIWERAFVPSARV